MVEDPVPHHQQAGDDHVGEEAGAEEGSAEPDCRTVSGQVPEKSVSRAGDSGKSSTWLLRIFKNVRVTS